MPICSDWRSAGVASWLRWTKGSRRSPSATQANEKPCRQSVDEGCCIRIAMSGDLRLITVDLLPARGTLARLTNSILPVREQTERKKLALLGDWLLGRNSVLRERHFLF